MEIQARIRRESVSTAESVCVHPNQKVLERRGEQALQSTEHIPPISPSVLLYPTKKLSGLFHFSPAK
jgi:hypothetical protein